MSQINGVSGVRQPHITRTNSRSSVDKDGRSFSSYLKVDKDLNDIFERAAEKYNVSKTILMKNYSNVREMTEEQVDQAIALLESLVAYYKTEVK